MEAWIKVEYCMNESVPLKVQVSGLLIFPVRHATWKPGIFWYSVIYKITSFLYSSKNKTEDPQEMLRISLNISISLAHKLTAHNRADFPVCVIRLQVKGKGHTCTGSEALYRPYGP